MQAETLPYLVLGDSRRTLLAHKLRSVVLEWGRRWIGELQPAVVVEPALSKTKVASEAASHECFAVSVGDQLRPRMYALCPATLLPALLGGRHALPDTSAAGSRTPIAAALQSEVLESLASSRGSAAGGDNHALHLGRLNKPFVVVP
jgi:hypothetical protein